jgi:peptide/nickel transport system permease protein
MIRYLAKRLISLVPILLGVTMLVFLLVHMIPGDPAAAMLGTEAAPEAVAALRQEMGLDQPLHTQYLTWLGKMLRGDLGRSLHARAPVAELLVEKYAATAQLGLVATIISLAIAIPAGIVSAVRKNSLVDYLATVGSLIGVSMPNFWLGITLILFFSLHLRWLPASGYVPFFQAPLENLKYTLLPAITLGTALAAVVARQTRSAMLEVLKEDYIRTARAKGLPERIVVYRHALRNGMIPIVTVVGLQIGRILGGVVITETIFAWPGIGKLVVDGIFARDFPVVQSVTLMMAFTFVVINLVVDLLYGYFDPRIRY